MKKRIFPFTCLETTLLPYFLVMASLNNDGLIDYIIKSVIGVAVIAAYDVISYKLLTKKAFRTGELNE